MFLEIPLYVKKKCSNYARFSNNVTLVSENSLFNLKQNVETQTSCVYQQLFKVKSV